MYLIGLLIILSLTFCTYWSYDENVWSSGVKLAYNIFAKKLYVIGLFMFCLPLMMNKLPPIFGGWMGSSIFLPLSRLSYSVYIIHPLIIKFVLYNYRYAYNMNGKYIILMGLSYIVCAYILSILICTLFEMPFQNIRNIFKNKIRPTTDIRDNKNMI